MRYRKKISKGKSRRLFKNTANRTHKINVVRKISRGGIQL